MSNRSSDAKLEIMKRRALVMQLVENNDTLTYEQIATRMRANNWVLERWPGYAATSARDDFMNNLALMEDDVRALASIYLVRQLGIIDRSIKRLEDIADDEKQKPHVRIAATTGIGPFLEKEIKIFGNYSAAEVKIDKREVTLNLDQFHEIRKRARESSVVEGEILEEQDALVPLSASLTEEEE